MTLAALPDSWTQRAAQTSRIFRTTRGQGFRGRHSCRAFALKNGIQGVHGQASGPPIVSIVVPFRGYLLGSLI